MDGAGMALLAVTLFAGMLVASYLGEACRRSGNPAANSV